MVQLITTPLLGHLWWLACMQRAGPANIAVASSKSSVTPVVFGQTHMRPSIRQFTLHKEYHSGFQRERQSEPLPQSRCEQ